MARITSRLTPAEVDYLHQDLLIALTRAEDLGLDDDVQRLERIKDDLLTYSVITAPDQIFLYQFYE